MTSRHNLWIPLYLFCCIVLGGASNGGFLANAVLQVFGTILIAWAFWNPSHSPIGKRGRAIIWLLLAIIFVMLLQFLPLPAGIWDMPAGRAELAKEGAELGIEYTPLLWALLPYEAAKSAIWLLPAIALTTALLRSPSWQPQHLAWAILSAMVLSVLLGALQLAQGQGSAAYFYAITNRGSTVGFFANSNHLATLLLVSLPLTAALVAQQVQSGQKQFSASMMAIGAGLVMIALAGIAANGSLTGFALAGPVAAGSMMILVSRRSVRRASLIILPSGLIAGLAWLFFSEEGSELLELEGVSSSNGSRQQIWAITMQAIGDHMPLGSGLGSFAEIYPRYENQTQIANFYINHAHNDYLELVLELGVVAVPILLIFLAWWARNLVRVWLDEAKNPFAFAGAIVSSTILTHSIVDYPLRTAAISCIFAVSLCLLAASRARNAHQSGDGR